MGQGFTDAVPSVVASDPSNLRPFPASGCPTAGHSQALRGLQVWSPHDGKDTETGSSERVSGCSHPHPLSMPGSVGSAGQLVA